MHSRAFCHHINFCGVQKYSDICEYLHLALHITGHRVPLLQYITTIYFTFSFQIRIQFILYLRIVFVITVNYCIVAHKKTLRSIDCYKQIKVIY